MLCMDRSIVSMESKATITSRLNRNSHRKVVLARVEKANRRCLSHVEVRETSQVAVHSLYHLVQKLRQLFSNRRLKLLTKRYKSIRKLRQENCETKLKWTKLSTSQVSSLTQQITPCSKNSPVRLTMRWPRPSRPSITIKALIKTHHKACISKA